MEVSVLGFLLLEYYLQKENQMVSLFDPILFITKDIYISQYYFSYILQLRGIWLTIRIANEDSSQEPKIKAQTTRAAAEPGWGMGTGPRWSKTNPARSRNTKIRKWHQSGEQVADIGVGVESTGRTPHHLDNCVGAHSFSILMRPETIWE